MNEPGLLIDFSESDKSSWTIVADVVMGGVSSGGMRRTDRGTGVFSGRLSRENNGGFVSARTVIGPCDLSAFAGVEILLRGDGRAYQLRLRTDDRYDGIAYRAGFASGEGEWITVRIPFDRFEASFRGRTIPEAPALDISHIHQVGIMLVEGKPGSFSLEIDHIRTWRESAVER